MSDTYRVVVTREHGLWLVDVPELEGAHAFARNLSSLDRGVREVIAVVLDLPAGGESGLNLQYEFRTGDEELDQAAAQLRAQRAQLNELSVLLPVRTAELVLQLRGNRLSVRDVAVLVGVSAARVSQIAPEQIAAQPAKGAGW